MAITFLDEIYHADNVQIFHSDRTIEKRAYATIRKYTGQDFSIADCVSFTIMKREGLKRAFTFDKPSRRCASPSCPEETR